MRRYLCLFGVVALLLVAADDKDDAKKEIDRFQGTWKLESVEVGGEAVSQDNFKDVTLTIEGNKFTTHRPDRPDQTHTVTIDSAVSPKRLTVDQTPPMRAIYAVEGNRMRLCVMVDENPNAGYPTEMVSRASPKTDLLTLERRTESQPPPGNLQGQKPAQEPKP